MTAFLGMCIRRTRTQYFLRVVVEFSLLGVSEDDVGRGRKPEASRRLRWITFVCDEGHISGEQAFQQQN